MPEAAFPRTTFRSTFLKSAVYPDELIFKIEPSLVAETMNESADAQKPPTPQQASQQQQQQQQLSPLQQQQQQPSGGIGGGIGGGDGTPAATPTSAVNVQQSQQAVPSATPTLTTANPHSAAGPPSNNQPSPHPSPLYPGIPQQAGQPNGSTQGKTRTSI
ncbi:phosphatase and actin [Lasius niger]|uniref:Phosphatase and actin n=1 Tax=Lasius niger TaxID=67767 RepID=A0A0J7KV02_LASNI|nr:phosphatase and actin [Lasius niger]